MVVWHIFTSVISHFDYCQCFFNLQIKLTMTSSLPSSVDEAYFQKLYGLPQPPLQQMLRVDEAPGVSLGVSSRFELLRPEGSPLTILPTIYGYVMDRSDCVWFKNIMNKSGIGSTLNNPYALQRTIFVPKNNGLDEPLMIPNDVVNELTIEGQQLFIREPFMEPLILRNRNGQGIKLFWNQFSSNLFLDAMDKLWIVQETNIKCSNGTIHLVQEANVVVEDYLGAGTLL